MFFKECYNIAYLKQSYDEIMSGEEFQKVKRAFNGDESIDVLCRGCSSATEIKRK